MYVVYNQHISFKFYMYIYTLICQLGTCYTPNSHDYGTPVLRYILKIEGVLN